MDDGNHIFGQFWLSYNYDRDNTPDKLDALMDEFLDYIIEFAEKRDASIPSIMRVEDFHGNLIMGDEDEDEEDDIDYYDDEETVLAF